MAKFSVTEKKYILERITKIINNNQRKFCKKINASNILFEQSWNEIIYKKAYINAAKKAIKNAKNYNITVTDKGDILVNIPTLDLMEKEFKALFVENNNKLQIAKDNAIEKIMLGNCLEDAQKILITLQKL